MSSVKTSARAVATGAAPDDLALFHKTLAAMCRADTPLPKALRLLQGDLRRGAFRDAVAEMAEDVEGGLPLGEVYARRKDSFPPLYCALVEAGMVSGDLPGVLDEIARHAERRAEAAARFRKALAYPMAAAGLVLAVGLALVLFVRPMFWEVPERVGIEQPLDMTWIALAVLGAVVAATLAGAWLRGPLDGVGPGRFRLPFLGRLRLYAAKAQIAATLSLLLRRLVPLPNALDLTAGAVDDEALADELHAAAREAEQGQSLGAVLQARALFEPTLLWLVATADGGGDAHRALQDIGEIYTRRLDRAFDRITTIVTPVAELIVGAVVFVFAYSFMSPLLDWALEIFRP